MATSVLSVGECDHIIGKILGDKKFELVHYEVKPLNEDGHRAGHLGEHFKATTVVNINNTSQTFKLFLKKRVVDFQHSPFSEIMYHDAFTKEYDFSLLIEQYAQNPSITDNKFWGVQCFTVIDDSLLVMEDISAKGYKLVEPQNMMNFDLKHCLEAIKSLVQLHTFGYCLEHKIFQVSLDQELPALMRESLFHNENQTSRDWTLGSKLMLYEMLKLVPNHREDVLSKFLKYYETIFDEWGPSTRFPNMLTHGDLWGNNIMFTYQMNQPIHCKFVDYQTLRYAPITDDLLFILIVNTTREFQKENMDYMNEFYYSELSRSLDAAGLDIEELFPKTLFLESCQESFYKYSTISLIYKVLIHLGDDLTRLMDTKGFHGANRMDYLNPVLEENSNYKQTVITLMEEFHAVLQEQFNCYN